MTVEEVYKTIEELKGSINSPFDFSQKGRIETMYQEVLGKTFAPTSCQSCYHDALIEIYCYLKKHGKMKEKTKYALKAGAIIRCPLFHDGEIYTNETLTDEIAREYLQMFPNQQGIFQSIPKEDTEEYEKKEDDETETQSTEDVEETSDTEDVEDTSDTEDVEEEAQETKEPEKKKKTKK